jgi:tetratricopeptide (TPR) repeat protein
MTGESGYKHDLFISYNQADEEWARKLAACVEQEKRGDRNLRVFFAPWDIRPGESVNERLDRALAESCYVGLVLSPEAVASQWVSEEWYSAHHADIKRKERRLIPLYRRTCDIPRLIAHLNHIDFRDDDKFDSGLRLLLAVLREEPLPRGERADSSKDVRLAPTIPRPPVIGFVARRDAQGRDIIGRLKAELAPESNQLVTLSGPGGIGKTTLAAEAARRLQEAYENRIVWCSAEGRSDFTLLSLLDDIATQLKHADLRTLSPAEKAEQVRALVGSSPTLVVLDNYETIDANEKGRIEAWFRSAQCPSLFTSRPKVPETIFVPISAMSRDEAAEFLENLTGQTQDPQIFTPEVCDHVYRTAEANPYVMQWVVAQIDEAQEPDTVLKELAEGEGDVAERVFTRSFSLPQLGDDGRDVLLALSLAAPSASREALMAVASMGEDHDRLEQAVKHLYALWLIKGVNKNRRLAIEGLTRSMAAARLSKDSRAGEFRRRFVAYFLSYVMELREPSPENFNALEAEKNNLLSAAEMALALEDWGSVMEMAYVLSNPVDGMLSVRGYWDEAVRLGEQSLHASRAIQDEEQIESSCRRLAGMYLKREELVEARRLYGESMEINKRLGNRSGIALTSWGLGNIFMAQGFFDEAKEQYQKSLEIFRELGEERHIAGAINQLGMIAKEKGDHQEGRRLYGESLEIKKRLGDEAGAAATLHNLAVLAQEQGELEEARRLYLGSLDISRRLGDQSSVATTLHELGRFAEEKGDAAEAIRLYREALVIFQRIGSPDEKLARDSLAGVEDKSS